MLLLHSLQSLILFVCRDRILQTQLSRPGQACPLLTPNHSHSEIWLNRITWELIYLQIPRSVTYLLNWDSWGGGDSVQYIVSSLWVLTILPCTCLALVGPRCPALGPHVPCIVSSHLGCWALATLHRSLDFYVWPQILFL